MLFNSVGSSFTGSLSTIPSSTHNGSRLPIIVEEPRIRIFGAAPTVEVICITDIPGTFPCNIWSSDEPTGSIISSAPNDTIDDVNSLFLNIWYPVINTSSISFTRSFMTIVTGSSESQSKDSVSIPKNEKSNILFSGTRSWKLPFVSVDVPVTVPLIITDTPGIGSPFSSFTTPFATRVSSFFTSLIVIKFPVIL